jgi:hypothetical protein
MRPAPARLTLPRWPQWLAASRPRSIWPESAEQGLEAVRRDEEHAEVVAERAPRRVVRRKAARGDASAARELREWLDLEESVSGDEWMRVLDERERRIVRRIIARAKTRANSGEPVEG